MAHFCPASARLVLTHTRLATMAGTGTPYGLVEDGAVVIENGHIAWAGPVSELDGSLANGARRVACDGRLLTPGLIDCHTHLVYGGDRAGEFEMRLTGVPYAETARRGGGIVSTVKATRAADEAALYESGLKRLDALLSEGVTTVEIKSGYGLDTASEIKMLRVARRLGAARPVTVVTSFLGAHALPPEYRNRRDDYVALVAEEMIPAVAGEGLADAVDGFCETIAFSAEEMARVFDAATAHGLPVKLHAEQLSNLGGAALAARYGAMSADHLEYLDAPGIAAMARAGTVAVLLPGAFYYLGETRLPPVAGLRDAGVPIAVATDLNPGSSPVHSLLAAMNMACVLFRLTPEEALKGATVNAARALRLDDRGMIAAGMRADLCLWEVEHPAALAYTLGYNPLAAALKDGKPVRGGLVL